MSTLSTLIRRIDLDGFAGDSWATPGDQSLAGRDVPLAVSTRSEILWRVVPYTGIADDAIPVSDTQTLIDARLALLALDAQGNTTVAMTPGLLSCSGVLRPLGLELRDALDVGRVLAFAIPSINHLGPAAALWIFADYGAVLR